jgi:hypothetical protein
MNLLTINKQLATLRPKVSGRIEAKTQDHSVVRRSALLLLMSSASVLTAIVGRFLVVESFWHYCWLMACLVFSILTLVELLRGGFFHLRP